MFEWVCEQSESFLGDIVGEHACAVVISFFVVLGTVLCIIYFRNKPVPYLYGRSSTRLTDTGVSPGRSSSRSKHRRRRTSRRRKYYYY